MTAIRLRDMHPYLHIALILVSALVPCQLHSLSGSATSTSGLQVSSGGQVSTSGLAERLQRGVGFVLEETCGICGLPVVETTMPGMDTSAKVKKASTCCVTKGYDTGICVAGEVICAKGTS